MSNNRYHRAFGVYGIYVVDGKLLVINKNGGPYINRFDLPGGSLEEGETLSEAMKRKFLEEKGTGLFNRKKSFISGNLLSKKRAFVNGLRRRKNTT